MKHANVEMDIHVQTLITAARVGIHLPRVITYKRWGKHIVTQMNTSHIQNTILCIQGKGKTPIIVSKKNFWLDVFYTELISRQ